MAKVLFFVKPMKWWNGSFFASFVREKLPRCFVRAGREKRCLFVMDNDPSQVLNAAKLVSKTSMLSSTKFHQIHPRSPCLNSIENIFHIVRKMLEQEAIRLQIEHETFNDFKTRVMRCFDSIPTDLIHRMRSMPTPIKQIIASKGARIEY